MLISLEEAAVLADPPEQAVHALGGADAGRPAEQAPGLADVGHEDALVARPPVGAGRVEGPAERPLQHGHQLVQAQGVAGPAAEVERLARDRVDPLEGPLVGVDQVVDPERVADLLAVAEDRERPAHRRRDAEPGDPALVLDAELPRPVDAVTYLDSTGDEEVRFGLDFEVIYGLFAERLDGR